MRKVLVFDDDNTTARILVKLLQLEGYEAAFAISEEAAVETAATFRPDVVVIDLAMPVVTGYEVAKKLKQPGVRIISYTGHARGKGGGDDSVFDEYLLQPASIETLRRAIDGGRLTSEERAAFEREIGSITQRLAAPGISVEEWEKLNAKRHALEQRLSE